jgi:hypothetical protein
MNFLISNILTVFLLISRNLLVDATIRACFLNAANTTDCYRENLEGMIKLMGRMREKPDPMHFEDISFREPYEADGVAKIEMYTVQFHNILSAEVYKTSTAYNGDERSFSIDATVRVPNVRF